MPRIRIAGAGNPEPGADGHRADATISESAAKPGKSLSFWRILRFGSSRLFIPAHCTGTAVLPRLRSPLDHPTDRRRLPEPRAGTGAGRAAACRRTALSQRVSGSCYQRLEYVSSLEGRRAHAVGLPHGEPGPAHSQHVAGLCHRVDVGAYAARGFWAAAFFAVAEGHQEAVMWFTAINELWMFLFGAAALLCWMRGSRAGIPLFALALLSKESAVIFLPLFLLAAPDRDWRRWAPYAGLAAAMTASIFLGVPSASPTAVSRSKRHSGSPGRAASAGCCGFGDGLRPPLSGSGAAPKGERPRCCAWLDCCGAHSVHLPHLLYGDSQPPDLPRERRAGDAGRARVDHGGTGG